MKTLLSVLLVIAAPCLAETVIEGRVELPKTRPAPVVNKRYEIVASGGVRRGEGDPD